MLSSPDAPFLPPSIHKSQLRQIPLSCSRRRIRPQSTAAPEEIHLGKREWSFPTIRIDLPESITQQRPTRKPQVLLRQYSTGGYGGMVEMGVNLRPTQPFSRPSHPSVSNLLTPHHHPCQNVGSGISWILGTTNLWSGFTGRSRRLRSLRRRGSRLGYFSGDFRGVRSSGCLTPGPCPASEAVVMSCESLMIEGVGGSSTI